MASNDVMKILNTKYQIVETLSQGTFSTLLRVLDITVNNEKRRLTARQYKLKPNEEIEKAKSHLAILQQFVNPYLIQYLDWFVDKESNSFYVFMNPFDDLKSLNTLLDECKKEKKIIPNDIIQWWSIQLLKGLDFLHKYDIIHNNIKPTNLFIRDDENIILGEVGFIRDPVVMTDESVELGVGTLNYMAPEIVKNYVSYSKKIDVWSFGCVLYEVIKLKRLIEGRKAQVISYLINFKEYNIDFDAIPSLFLPILKKSLTLLPEQRISLNSLLDTLSKDFKAPVSKSIKKVKNQNNLTKQNSLASLNNLVKKSISINYEPLKESDQSSRIFETKILENSLVTDKTKPNETENSLSIDDVIQKGDTLLNLTNFNEALKYYEKAISIDKHHIDSYFKKAKCLRSLLRYNEAIEYFDIIIKMDPNHLGAFNYKAFCLKALYKSKEAEELFEKANQGNLNPSTALDYFNKALSLHGLKRYNESLENYEKATELSPNDPFYHNNKAILLKILGKFDEANKCYQRAIELEPNYAYAFNNFAILLSELNQNEKSLEYFNRAIELYAGYADAYKNKGNALFDLKRYQESVECYLKALEFDPNCINAYNNLGNAYLYMKKYNESLESYNKAICLNPKSLDSYLNKAILYKQMKMFKEALQSYEKIIELDPNNDNAIKSRNELLNILNRN